MDDENKNINSNNRMLMCSLKCIDLTTNLAMFHWTFVKLKIHFYKFPHACTGNSGLYLYMCSDKKEGAGAIS